MRPAACLLALLACGGCASLDPAAGYREAARNLRFHLERVEPRLDLAFPPERSRVRLRLHLGVENDSPLRLVARSLGGDLSLQVGDRSHVLGRVAFPEGLDLAPRGRSGALAEITLGYGEVRAAWGPLTEAVQLRKAATWRLEGEAKVEVHGFPLTLPLKAATRSGG
jgi:hypothetical protein